MHEVSIRPVPWWDWLVYHLLVVLWGYFLMALWANLKECAYSRRAKSLWSKALIVGMNKLISEVMSVIFMPLFPSVSRWRGVVVGFEMTTWGMVGIGFVIIMIGKASKESLGQIHQTFSQPLVILQKHLN